MKNNKSGFKLPKSVLDKVNTSKPTSLKKAPETADEYLAQGIDDEESGDRWYSSDLLKSLRFYQRAYDGYLKSLELDDTLLDSYYNLSRLLFHVNNSFIKIDQIKLNTLGNIENCFGNVIQEMPLILKYHEFVLSKFESLGRRSWDLIFNSALIYQEYIDESEELNLDQILELTGKSMMLYQQYLEHQISELAEILKIDEQYDNDVSSSEPKDEIDEIEIITPALILDTVISGYGLVQTVYESASSADDVMLINTRLDGFLQLLQAKAELVVVENYGDKFNTEQDLKNLSAKKLELQRLDLFIKLFTLSSIKDVISALKTMEENYKTSFEFYLSANDLLNNLIANFTPLENGEAYTLMSSFYKKAQDILVKEFEAANSNDDSYSSKISLLLKVFISRSDIEYLRSVINKNENNKQILLRNSVNLLKNLINWTNKNGGLRENIIDQLNRMYLRKKATLRLTFMEKGTIEGELKNPNDWKSELEELKELYQLQSI